MMLSSHNICEPDKNYEIPLRHDEETLLICRDVHDRRSILDKLKVWSDVGDRAGQKGEEWRAQRKSFEARKRDGSDVEIRLKIGRYVGHILLDEDRSLSLSPPDLNPNLAFMMAVYCAARRFTLNEAQLTPSNAVDCNELFDFFAQQFVNVVKDLFESSVDPLLYEVEVEHLQTVDLQRRDTIEWDKQYLAAVLRNHQRNQLANPPFCVRRVYEHSDFLENRLIKTALCAILSRGPDAVGHRTVDEAETLLSIAAFDDVSEFMAGEVEDSRMNGFHWDEHNGHLRAAVMLACVLLHVQLPDLSDHGDLAATVSSMRPQFLLYFPWCAACLSSTPIEPARPRRERFSPA